MESCRSIFLPIGPLVFLTKDKQKYWINRKTGKMTSIPADGLETSFKIEFV
jgi:hypothetical protein